METTLYDRFKHFTYAPSLRTISLCYVALIRMSAYPETQIMKAILSF